MFKKVQLTSHYQHAICHPPADISRQPSLFNHQDPTISPSNHKNYKYQAAARQPREFFFNVSMWMIIRKYCVIFLIISYKNIERPTPYPSSIEQEKRHSGHSKSTDVRGQLSLPAQDLGNFPRPLFRGSQSARRRRRDWW
jgi:hypothetical protein